LGLNSVGIKQVLRRLRGGSQAFLVQGSDDLFYATKFAGNPQGTRTLINEWIVGQLLQTLQVSTPPLRILQLDALTDQDELHFQMGNKQVKIQGGLHLGSRCPVNPETTAILDFLPRPALAKIVNLPEFAFLFVFDQWVGQTDKRQAIFVREKGSSAAGCLRAYFLDHGLCFGGPKWTFRDSPLQGLYVDRTVYRLIPMADQCAEAVHRIQALSEDVLYSAAAELPREWFAEGDFASLIHLLRTLEQRKQKLSYLVQQALQILQETNNQSAA
jgi:hypothetical protein